MLFRSIAYYASLSAKSCIIIDNSDSLDNSSGFRSIPLFFAFPISDIKVTNYIGLGMFSNVPSLNDDTKVNID